ncbi:hypothetical protein C0J52_04263 [Blattella germanica]|nr:hypothetical protein C0J52_04263 [Blattella germanica]
MNGGGEGNELVTCREQDNHSWPSPDTGYMGSNLFCRIIFRDWSKTSFQSIPLDTRAWASRQDQLSCIDVSLLKKSFLSIVLRYIINLYLYTLFVNV